ncbi:MAG: ABC transporter ATP-binding protein [Acidobacteriota bacterium]
MSALEISDLTHRYGDRASLRGVGFSVAPGDLFALLGPNGGGKTTLFRIIATLLLPSSGAVDVFGVSALSRPARARRMMGVVFQSPALDPWLTVVENLQHHGLLYGVHGPALARAVERSLERFGLMPRAADRVATLSGGLRRRVELAKALLPEPRLLLLDEPSAGLDPVARRDLLAELGRLRDDAGTTVVLTTHITDEAAACDRVGVLHEGRLVAIGRPQDLIDAIGGDVVTIDAADAEGAETLATRLEARFGVQTRMVGGRIRLERRRAHEFVPALIESFPGDVRTVSVGRPTLEDVFVHHTGMPLGDGDGRP